METILQLFQLFPVPHVPEFQHLVALIQQCIKPDATHPSDSLSINNALLAAREFIDRPGHKYDSLSSHYTSYHLISFLSYSPVMNVINWITVFPGCSLLRKEKLFLLESSHEMWCSYWVHCFQTRWIYKVKYPSLPCFANNIFRSKTFGWRCMVQGKYWLPPWWSHGRSICVFLAKRYALVIIWCYDWPCLKIRQHVQYCWAGLVNVPPPHN